MLQCGHSSVAVENFLPEKGQRIDLSFNAATAAR